MVTCTYQKTHITDPTMAEAVARLQAITVVTELGFRSLVLEGDCSMVITRIKDFNDDRLYLSMIIQEIKLKPLRFESFTCSLIRRSTNQTAHTLAVEGKRWPNQQAWIEKASHIVEVVVERDRIIRFSDENGSEEIDTL